MMILVSSAILDGAEKAMLAKVIDSGWITMGERVLEFEAAFASIHGADDSVAVSSCTAGLHLILHALGIGPGDEVLVPSMSFVATANSVLYVGAKPVFVDIESEELPLMSLAQAQERCTPKTKAIILVHFAGYVVDLEKWRDFAHKNGLFLVEDAAHAPGLREVGAISDAAAFSFYGNKNMTTAEGGAVIARDPELLQKIRQARGHGMTSSTHQRLNSRTSTYDVTMLGFNYRLDELRAAIGLVQLNNLLEWNEIRRVLVALYRRLISLRCPQIIVPFSDNMVSAYHILPVLLPPHVERQNVVDYLRANGVQTTIHYPPIHKLTYYRTLFPNVQLPKTDAFAARELTIPLHPLLTSADVEAVVSALEYAVQGSFRNGEAA
jgi:dTDP-4-amino-4,6-dideoxygalactose transaminase